MCFLKKIINWISICRTAYGISPDRNLRDRQVIPLLLLSNPSRCTTSKKIRDAKSWPMGQVSPDVTGIDEILDLEKISRGNDSFFSISSWRI